MEVRNRFKGLDLIDRVPEELCMELCDTVQEAVIKIIPKKKKCKKAKWFLRSEKSLKIAVTRREAVEKAMATHSSTLAWKIPWTEEPGKLQTMGLQELDMS